MKMERKPGLLKEKLSVWKGKKWYHQRFDGVPYFLAFVGEAEIVTHRNRKKDLAFDVHFSFYSNERGDWYISQDDIERVSRTVIDRARHNPQYSKKLMDEWHPREEKFYELCKKMNAVQLSDLSDDELLNVHDTFSDTYLARFSSSSIIDGFALGTDHLIAGRLEVLYKRSEIAKTRRFSEVFSVITAPIHLSFVNVAERDLHTVALAVKDNPAHKKQLLDEYRDKYFWTRNNYANATVLTMEYFENELEHIYASGIDSQKEIEKINNKPIETQKIKEQYMGTLDVDTELKTLIQITEDFTHWQDERKKSTFFTTHYLSLVLTEVSRRTNIPVELIKYTVPQDLRDVFAGRFDVQTLKKLQQHSVYYHDSSGYDSVYGDEADVVKKTIVGAEDLSDIQDFRGLAASLGRVRGSVKVLRSVKEINKIQDGDILVAVMTRPDYVPAMKKAGAIVTDEGGITSHAAIVSRELGIPCVIGTKIATKVLQDGDLVEVDANHSVVKKIVQ